MAWRSALLFLSLALACAHGPSRKERESAEIHYNLGTEALRGGRTQDALKEYDEALALDERFADAHLGRGLAMEFGFGRLDEAEREYRRALALRPSFPEAHNNLGQLLAKTGRLGEAVGEFDLALGNMLYKEPYVARCNKGEALHRLGKKQEGIAELKACLSLSYRYCQGYRQLGGIQLAEGRMQEAIESLGQYAKYCEKSADAHYQLGLAFLKSGDADKARQAFERCESLAGDGVLATECRKSREMLQ
jgi:type IV pilus assembly protein PilF